MNARTAKTLAWSVLVLMGLLAAVGGWLAALNVGSPIPEELSVATPSSYVILLPSGLSFVVVGALIVARRPGNRIGVLFLAVGVVGGLSGVATQYAIHALIADPGSLPGGAWAAWVRTVAVPLVVPIFVFLPLWFPDGRPPSRRWRPVEWLGIVTMALLVLALFAPGPIEVFDVENPAGIPGFEVFVGLAGWPLLLSTIGAIVAVVVRFRRSRGEERQQLKWFTFAAAALFVLFWLGDAVFGAAEQRPLGQILTSLAVAALPVSIGIAVLRYRLYDIDVVIRKTVVAGLMAAFISVVYVAMVIGVGALVGSGGNALLSAIAAAIVALAFQPIRARARRLADRLVYGRRATPYEALSEFSERAGETYAIEDVLPRMARMLAEATGASRAEVWLTSGPELRRAASHPPGSPSATALLRGGELPAFDEASLASPVRHQGELLGALVVTKPPSDPVTPAEEALVTDLATQAGLVLRNAVLIEDLRRSRQRLVAAQDEERRRLERNLHDGAQQQLVALAVKLRLVESLIPKDPERAARMTREVSSDAGDALDTLRDLARGIYPPLLADRGLPAALEAQARRAAVPVTIDAGGVGRYPQVVEAAVYFSCLEALQNVVKYAAASSVSVRLRADDGLVFEIHDDGRGFDTSATTLGTGLQGIADRVSAIGGTLDVRSSPGKGTTITGRIPVEPLQQEQGAAASSGYSPGEVVGSSVSRSGSRA
jgi:signal transduction histidine kinase